MFRSLTVKEAAERNQVSKLADEIESAQPVRSPKEADQRMFDAIAVEPQADANKTGHDALADTLKFIESGDARKAQTILEVPARHAMSGSMLERTLPTRAGAVAVLLAMVGMTLGVGVAGICDEANQQPSAVSRPVCPKSGGVCDCVQCMCPETCPGQCGCSVALASKP